MTTTSPMLQAIDLPRVNLDVMTLEELEAHAKCVLDTIGALNEYINSPARKSSNAKLNAMRQALKLRTHMARVRDLLNALTAAAAMVAGQSVGAGNLAPGSPRFGF